MKRTAEAIITLVLIATPAALYFSGLPGLEILGAVAFLFAAPGLLAVAAFMQTERFRGTAPAWSLLVNTLALMIIFLLLRGTVGVEKFSFSGFWLAWTILLAVAARRAGGIVEPLAHLCKRYGTGLLTGSLVMAAMAAALYPEQFVQCFAEDGTETFELARSLKHHLLPYWELETSGGLGTVVVNPSLINSYWTCALQVLLGENETSTRLPYWIWSLAAMAVCYRILVSTGNRWPAAVALGLCAALTSLLFTFYVGYNPYMADLANPGVPDAMFTLLLLLSLECLRQKDRWGFALSILAASLVLYSGPIFAVVILASAWVWQPIKRKEVFAWANVCGFLLLGALVFYLLWGWAEGSLVYWVDTIDIEYVNDYLSPVPRWKSGALFLGYFLLASGGIASLGLIVAFRRDPWQRTVATAALLYLAIILCSGFKNLHYFAPLLPLPLLLFLAQGKRGKTLPWRRSVLAICSLLVCILVCWPAQRQTFTINRMVGNNTTITTDSYEKAVRWTTLRFQLQREGILSWDCDQHTWAAYAKLEEKPEFTLPLVLTDSEKPVADYLLLASGRVEGSDATIRLYAENKYCADRLQQQKPLRPLQRYPLVFRPLADGIYSPHNNTLEDVRRLEWR